MLQKGLFIGMLMGIHQIFNDISLAPNLLVVHKQPASWETRKEVKGRNVPQKLEIPARSIWCTRVSPAVWCNTRVNDPRHNVGLLVAWCIGQLECNHLILFHC